VLEIFQYLTTINTIVFKFEEMVSTMEVYNEMLMILDEILKTEQ